MYPNLSFYPKELELTLNDKINTFLDIEMELIKNKVITKLFDIRLTYNCNTISLLKFNFCIHINFLKLF